MKVLMMHEIIDDDVVPRDSMQINYNEYALLLNKLKKNTVLSLDSFYCKFSKREFNGEYVITFDDVHKSVYEKAYPLLISNNLPFTLFVNLGLLDTKDYISKDQLKEMSLNSLCTIGSHGMNHVFHRKLKNKKCLEELYDSKNELEKLLNIRVNFFAFPYGSLVAVSIRNIKQVKKADYLMSFSTIPSDVSYSSLISKWFIPRINVTNKIIANI
ncbi:polysaccharide deacetylase family protein [Flavobacterium sp.]|uniref:polysaccharide deacetylase family protein n=1 Tax=Flavobacterium sp. TaxID=239 RepID=UPI001B64FE67|nr:polysaccharide deacetylase family protein [Flavobacterium sp.]MBP6182586.1 polysaccharide deacetylase family protein [Flavobacterium sp.]